MKIVKNLLLGLLLPFTSAMAAEVKELAPTIPENPAITICQQCGEPAQQKCGRCKAVFYCSPAHQRQSWPLHKKICSPEPAPIAARQVVAQFSQIMLQNVFPGWEHLVDGKKLLAMRSGQREAYAYVRQVLGEDNSIFFDQFLTVENLKNINKTLLDAFDDDNIGHHGETRDRMIHWKYHSIGMVQLGNVNYLFPMPPKEIAQSRDLMTKWMNSHGTTAWNSNDNNLGYMTAFPFTATPEQLAAAIKWTKKNLHIFPPQTAESMFDAGKIAHLKQDFLLAIAQEDQARVFAIDYQVEDLLLKRGPDGVTVTAAVEKLLDEYLGHMRSQLPNARGHKEKIMNLAAYAHMRFISIHPFHGGHKRTARVLMNTVMQYGGLKPVWFDDSDEYADVVMQDVVKDSHQSMLELIRRSYKRLHAKDIF